MNLLSSFLRNLTQQKRVRYSAGVIAKMVRVAVKFAFYAHGRGQYSEACFFPWINSAPCQTILIKVVSSTCQVLRREDTLNPKSIGFTNVYPLQNLGILNGRQ